MGVLTERHGAAAMVILDWPDRRNALGPEEATEVTAAVNDAVADPSVCGLVLTGNGAFCAGGNMRAAATRSGMDPDERRRIVYGAFQGLFRALIGVPVPTVAALDGPAVGMGFDLAMACDSCFVGPDGWGQQGWGKMGLVAGTGGVLFLRRRSPSALWAMLETQDRMDGTRLAQLGLAETVEVGTARERAVARIEALAPMSRAALEGYVELDREGLRRDLDAHLAVAVAHQVPLLASPEFAARVARTFN
jgi:2-(1,2-epoxy-1,2-dihydrophenyl)acetyl-CoA isomerase